MRVGGSLVSHPIWTLIRLLRPGETRAVVGRGPHDRHCIVAIENPVAAALFGVRLGLTSFLMSTISFR